MATRSPNSAMAVSSYREWNSVDKSSGLSLKVDSASMHRTTLRAKDRVYARRLALARAVQRRKNVLFNDGDEAGPNKSESRQRAWEDVKLELVSKGFIEFAGKTRMDIRKTDWQHVRRYVMDKRKREAHTGIIEEPITELDEVVMEIVGAEGILKSSTPVLNTSNESDIKQEEPSTSDLGQDVASSSKSDSAENEQDNSLDSRLINSNLLFPQLLQNLPDTTLINPIQFQSSVEEREYENKLRDYKLRREEYQMLTEKTRNEIENERLIQEKIRTKLLLAELAKHDIPLEVARS